MNVGRLSLDNLEKFGEYTGLYYQGRSFTNAERLDAAADLAAVLRAHGVGTDDKVMVMMPNSPDVAAAFQACWKLGAAIIPVTPQLGATEVRYMLQDSGARVVLTAPALAPTLQQACQGLDDFSELLTIGASGAAPLARDISGEIVQARGTLDSQFLAERTDDDLALLLYTSGTTGQPKGVMLTHRNMLSNAESIGAMSPEIPAFQKGLHVLPLSHSYGVLMMNLGYLFGSVSVLMPFFEIQGVFENLAHYRIERFSVVPTMLTYMLRYPDRDQYDLNALEKIDSGGAPLPNEVRLEFERVFGCEVREGYGMSECAPSATGYRDDESYRPGSVGRAIPGVAVSIRDDDDREVAAGVWGEICIQGPNVMTGYWNLPDATAEALAGGWLHSGDVGYVDEDGFVFITDRKKDLVIKGGENISPREVEEALFEHPDVAEAAVFGVPHPTYGEDLCAAVVAKAGANPSEGELRAHLAGKVTKFKIPSRFVFRDDLPKNPTGKIQKRQLRDELSES